MNHHAYYIEGSPAQFEAYKESLRPFWAVKFERFGIDEARELIALAGLKNFSEATFFIALSNITSEAQQALLKLFEEPQQGTTFVMILPHGTLLPTLKSRMLPYPTTEGSPLYAYRGESSVGKFLKAAGKERSDTIAKMLKDDEGVKERVLDFVNALEVELSKNSRDKKVREGLEDIARVRDYLRDRSPSLKMLLEHLALSLPQV